MRDPRPHEIKFKEQLAEHQQRERKAAADRRIIEAARALVDAGPIVRLTQDPRDMTCLHCGADLQRYEHTPGCRWDALRRALEALGQEEP